ncbi:hypothetical protein CASFOL_039725 [Castilleja foliolosa]|uniref:TF-B3 domain-containing protein n=1 Tax=Castilleja foliolosa TaxID=1961234 RepID=A0ABD3BG13_9LAMI
MAVGGEAPGPSMIDKGKAKLGEPSYFTSAHVQSARKKPGPYSGNKPGVKADEMVLAKYKLPRYVPRNKPGVKAGELAKYNLPRYVPRSLARDDMCLIIALTSQEVDGPKLELGADEAFLLTNREETVGNPSGRFSEDLHMTDVFNNQYRMILSNRNTGSPTQFLLNRDWSRFVYMNKLKAGDELWIFRLLDPVSKNTCYALRHFKNPGNCLVNSARSLTCPKPSPSIAPADVAPSSEKLQSELSKILTSHDVDPTRPELYIDASEAYTLTGCVTLLNPVPKPSHMMLTAFDEVERSYKMLLSHLSISRFITISGDWGNFVSDHKLKAGDKVLFYRYTTNEEGVEPYYELKYVRQKESEMDQQLKLPYRKRKPGPDSGGIPDSSFDLTKTLYAHQGNTLRLYFDVNEASLLTHNNQVLQNRPSSPIMIDLLVYDASDRPYDMMLTNTKRNDGEVIYTLASGWDRFVSSHGLKAGDKVTIYRIQGETKYKIRYIRAGLPSGKYKLRYTRAGLPSGSGTSGVGPSGSGLKEAEQG